MTDWNWQLVTVQDSLTEGPAWNGKELLYSHIDANLTRCYDPQNDADTIWRQNTNAANGMVFDRHGHLYACEGGGRRIVRYIKDQPTQVIVDNFEGNIFNEPNDLAIDTLGRIWFSDPNYGGRPTQLTHESVYRADPLADGSWQPTRVSFDTFRPNGVLLSKDEKILYVAESTYALDKQRQLRAYPIQEDGNLGAFYLIHDFGEGRGVDGMCLTEEGYIVATAGYQLRGPGPMIYIFAPDGNIISTHPAPADRPTNCTFAPGLSHDNLYVTFGGGQVYVVSNTTLRGHLAYPPR